MKKNEQSSYPLPEKVKTHVFKNLNNLKDLLKDNPAFFIELLRKCTLIGKPPSEKTPEDKDYVYFSDVEDFIKAAYPDYLKTNDGMKILVKSNEIANSVTLQSPIFHSIPISNSEEKDFRSALEKEIFDYCDHLNDYLTPSDVKLTGEENEGF